MGKTCRECLKADGMTYPLLGEGLRLSHGDVGERVNDYGMLDLGSFRLFPSSLRETGVTPRAQLLSLELTSLNSPPAVLLAPLPRTPTAGPS